MTDRLPLYFVLFAAVAGAQSDAPKAPSFEADRVLYIDHPVPLAPGVILSIFGNNLGPATGCQGDHDAQGIYQKELCNTQVLVGGVPSGLLFVQAGQINFQFPQETPIQGAADLTVVYQGRFSKSVAMPLGAEIPTLSVESPARVGMPIWLTVTLANGGDSDIAYPFMIYPDLFGCNEVEVRRDGRLLPRISGVGSQVASAIVGPGNPCGGIAQSSEPRFHHRLPLHLRYRFDQPGTYEVRLKQPSTYPSFLPAVTLWTKIEILPADDSARSQWLTEIAAHPPTETADLLADFLPSILGNPDEETLGLLIPYLEHPDNLVREYVKSGLTYWPADQLPLRIWEGLRQ
jgi:hypothetical protein